MDVNKTMVSEILHEALLLRVTRYGDVSVRSVV